MRCVILTGMSGSGKSTALKMIEDMGYYCVGNLPISLVESFAELAENDPALEYPRAGSTFQRPEGYVAGKLIEDAGLRGFRVGDAQVSEKHCGFVINRGTASAAQIMELMQHVQERVKESSGVDLEPEVRLLGF